MRSIRVSLIVVLFALTTRGALALGLSDYGHLLYEEDYNTHDLYVEDSKHNTFFRLNYRSWYDPSNEVVVIYMHGLQSNSQWNIPTFEYLYNTAGCNVYALDRRYSGLSEPIPGFSDPLPGQPSKLPGDYREYAHISNYRQWLDDLHQLVLLARSENPGKPVHMMGNSFGARMVLGYAINYPDYVDGLILSGPGTHMKVGLTPAELMLTFTNYWILIDTPLRDEWFTRDPEKLSFIENDRLAVRRATANFYKQGELLNMYNLQRLHEIQIPALIIAAANDDIIVVEGENPPSIRSGLYGGMVRSPVRRLVIYDEGEHFLYFEGDLGEQTKRIFETELGAPENFTSEVVQGAVKQDVVDEIADWIRSF